MNFNTNGVKINSDGITLFESVFRLKIDSHGLKFDSEEFRVHEL